MRKERKHFTPEERLAILRPHLLDKVPVWEPCEGLSLRPTVFYRCQKNYLRTEPLPFSLRNVPPPSGGKAETDRVLGEESADHGRGLG